MTGLFHTLGIGAEGLAATRQGVDTAGHNIANAHTEGYSRQRVNITQRDPLDTRGLIIGNGAYIKSITRAHDKFIENEINNVKQTYEKAKQTFDELKRIEGVFSPESDINVSDEMTKFFNAIQDVSQYPEDMIVRTDLTDAAQNLSSSFRRVDTSLRQMRQDVNDKIGGVVDDANSIIDNIAKLNISINSMELHDDTQANDLRDKQDLLLRQLSEKITVKYYRDERGMLTVRGANDTLLVDRGYSGKLGLMPGQREPSMVELCVLETDTARPKIITEANKSGKVAGMIDIRDRTIPHLLAKNNELAKTLADSINIVHRQGYGLNDYNKLTGRDFFEINNDVNFAARSINVSSLITESTDAISVAATPEASGDNVLANEMLRINEQKIMDDGKSTLNEYYANYIGMLGLDTKRMEHQTQATDILLTDLNARREAVAGVSLDEEATNLMKWQANFTASSRVITTVDEMLDTVLNLKR